MRKIHFDPLSFRYFLLISMTIQGFLWAFIVTYVISSIAYIEHALLFTEDGILSYEYMRLTVMQITITGIFCITAGIATLPNVIIFSQMRTIREIYRIHFWRYLNYLLMITSITLSGIFFWNGITMLVSSSTLMDGYNSALEILTTATGYEDLTRAIAVFEYTKSCIEGNIGRALYYLCLCMSIFGALIAIYMTNFDEYTGMLGGVLIGITPFFLLSIMYYFVSYLVTLGFIFLGFGLANAYELGKKQDRLAEEVERKIEEVFKSMPSKSYKK